MGEACELPTVLLPAPLKESTDPAGRVLEVRWALSAQPEDEPVASRTRSFGAVPPLHVVAAPVAVHPLSGLAEPLAHWSYPVPTNRQYRLGELSRDRVPAVTVTLAATAHVPAPVLVEHGAAEACVVSTTSRAPSAMHAVLTRATNRRLRWNRCRCIIRLLALLMADSSATADLVMS